MGRDLLAQDYMLKQITASLIYPQDKLGQEFWNKVYAKAYQQFGTTNIPVNTFNKVWIVPDDAEVIEKGNMAYVVKNHLKVMLEEDYLSLSKHNGIQTTGIGKQNRAHSIGSQVVREIVLPALEREVNEDKNFAPLRQVFSGVVLAAWYKRELKESFLGKVYTNKDRLKGVDQDPTNNQIIYQKYLKAFKKGVFNFIKEDVDKYSNETIPRKYFSGGVLTASYNRSVNGKPALNVNKHPSAAQLADAAALSPQEDIVTEQNYAISNAAMSTHLEMFVKPNNDLLQDALKSDPSGRIRYLGASTLEPEVIGPEYDFHTPPANNLLLPTFMRYNLKPLERQLRNDFKGRRVIFLRGIALNLSKEAIIGEETYVPGVSEVLEKGSEQEGPSSDRARTPFDPQYSKGIMNYETQLWALEAPIRLRKEVAQNGLIANHIEKSNQIFPAIVVYEKPQPLLFNRKDKVLAIYILDFIKDSPYFDELCKMAQKAKNSDSELVALNKYLSAHNITEGELFAVAKIVLNLGDDQMVGEPFRALIDAFRTNKGKYKILRKGFSDMQTKILLASGLVGVDSAQTAPQAKGPDAAQKAEKLKKGEGDQAMTIDDLSEIQLHELTSKLLKDHWRVLPRMTSDASEIDEILRWLATYETETFDKFKQNIYKKAIVRALTEVNSEKAGVFDRFYDRAKRLYSYVKRRVPAAIMSQAEEMIWESILPFLTGEELIQMYEPQIKRMNEIPKPGFYPEADYEQWATLIAMENRQRFELSLDRLNEYLNKKENFSETYTFFSFFDSLPLDQQRSIAETILKRLNDPHNQESISYSNFESLIGAVPQKVGVLTNLRILEHIYQERMNGLLDDIRQEYEETEYDDILPEENTPMPMDFYQRNLLTFMLYNPSPEVLKMTIRSWNIRREINDTELNKFNWLVAMVPKESGNTRDRRRQIHRYLIQMVTYRHVPEAIFIAEFMSHLFLSVDNKSFNRENINELLNFMLEFTNLGEKLQQHMATKANALLSQWQMEAKGNRPKAPKEFLTPERFSQLRKFMAQERIKGMIDSLETFNPGEKRVLSTRINQHLDTWNRLGFLNVMTSYIAFQASQGKIETEKFLKQLMLSQVLGDRFISKGRYANLPFDQEFLDHWSKPVSVDLPIPTNLEDARKLSYDGIRRDLLQHAGIISTDDWLKDQQKLQEHFASLNFSGLDEEQVARAREELVVLSKVIEEIVRQLNEGQQITTSQIQYWKRQLLPRGEADLPHWYRQFPAMREIIVNINQIGQIKPLDITEIKKITFNIEDDPQVFVQSFREPYPTCQRLTEPTQYNTQGQPINRSRQGQFLVASVKIEYKDGHEEIAARSQLELARVSAGPEVDAPVLIAERSYTGFFPVKIVQDQIANWASGDGHFIHYLVFADSYSEQQFMRTRIPMGFLPSDGVIYRDTYKQEGAVVALRVDSFGKREIALPRIVKRFVHIQKIGSRIDPKELAQQTQASVDEIENILGSLGPKVSRQPDGLWVRNTDAAMNGGIDVNAAYLNLHIKRDGSDAPMPFAQQDMAQLNNLAGLNPVILKIQPAIKSSFLTRILTTQSK
jgi:hypothetical protein